MIRGSYTFHEDEALRCVYFRTLTSSLTSLTPAGQSWYCDNSFLSSFQILCLNNDIKSQNWLVISLGIGLLFHLCHFDLPKRDFFFLCIIHGLYIEITFKSISVMGHACGAINTLQLMLIEFAARMESYMNSGV